MTPPNPVPVKIIFGCTGPLWFSDDETTAQHVLETLEQRGVTELDSARGYGPSEEKLGARGAAEKGFVISTKFSATWGNKPANRENIRRSMGKSLALLGVDHVGSVPVFVFAYFLGYLCAIELGSLSLSSLLFSSLLFYLSGSFLGHFLSLRRVLCQSGQK